MRSRTLVSYMVVLLVISVLLLTACTRERPAPTHERMKIQPTASVTRSSGVGTPTVTRTPRAVPDSTPSASPVSTRPATPQAAGTALPTPIMPTLPVKPTPTSAAATPGSTASGGEWHYYTVQRGDTLYSIAKRYNTTVDELKRLNGLTDVTIYVGQKLKVPGPEQPGEGTTVEYTVRPGDTLYSIALRFGVDVKELARANGITDMSTIYVGQKLIIPHARNIPGTRLYTVQPGDTLSGIALRFNVSLHELMRINNITDPDAIYVGQVLRIP